MNQMNKDVIINTDNSSCETEEFNPGMDMDNILLTKTIKDDYMFGAVMMEGDNCKILLEMILGKKLHDINVREQHSIVYNPKYHSVRLDIIATGTDGIEYNVEMQTLREFTELRARYYHSQMDVELLQAGRRYDELTEAYVIFICDYDPLKLGKMVYTIRNRCDEALDYDYQDGLHTIFLSTRGKNRDEINPELVKFLDYVRADLSDSTKDFNSDYVRQLQSTVDKVRLNGERRDEYMKLEQMLQDEYRIGMNEGMSQGISQGKVDTIKIFLNNTHDAMLVATSLSEPVDYIEKIARDNNIALK